MRIDLKIVAEDGKALREALWLFVEDVSNFRNSNARSEIPLKKGHAQADYDFTPSNDIDEDISQQNTVVPIPYPEKG